MSAIDDKFNDLRSRGFDLGAPLGSEEASAAGGRVRRYEHGHIYWSSATGAHEVRGGILSLYLANGGPGDNPNTGRRDLGYPISDELGTPPQSLFEGGGIYWTAGTDGCVFYGSVYLQYQRNSTVRLPITGTLAIAGGHAAYFDRGIIFSADGAPGVDRPLIGHFNLPQLGRAVLIDPENHEQRRFPRLVEFRDMERAYYNALRTWRPNIVLDLFNERLALTQVGGLARIPLSPTGVYELGTFMVWARTILEITPITPRRLEITPTDLHDRTLYNLNIVLPNGNVYPVAHHFLYTKKELDHFGLLHVTDLHVSGRNEGFRAKLRALGLADAADHYSNFQDNFKDFIRYANKLHDLGIADAVVATGDLIDYVDENGDRGDMDNFVRLHRLILGQPIEPGSPPGDPLRIPFFPTLGNHDYRQHPYDLRADIDLPGVSPRGDFRSNSALCIDNYTHRRAIGTEGSARLAGRIGQNRRAQAHRAGFFHRSGRHYYERGCTGWRVGIPILRVA